MRQSMSWRLCALEQVYHETKIGRKLTDDEQLERFTNWDVGLNAEILNAYYYNCMTQHEQASETKKKGREYEFMSSWDHCYWSRNSKSKS